MLSSVAEEVEEYEESEEIEETYQESDDNGKTWKTIKKITTITPSGTTERTEVLSGTYTASSVSAILSAHVIVIRQHRHFVIDLFLINPP